jgi:glycosyltransferase involved in cell wall biosynthesis
MASNNHIVFLIPGFAKNEADTVCIPALQVFITSYRNKYPEDRISIIAFEYPYFFGKYSWNGVSVYSCGGCGNKFKRPLTLWRAKSFFKAINTENPVNLIHSFWLGECAAIGKYLADKNGIAHLVTLMGQDVLENNKYIKKSHLLDETIIGLSDNHARVFKQNSGRAVNHIIPWGVEIDAQENDTNNSRPIDVIGVGNLTALKNFSLFIECIYELKKSVPNIKAVITGGGPEMERLSQQIDSMGLNDNVELKGQVSRDEVLRLLRHSKLLLHTSSFESFGLVFSEALAAGASIVSFNVGCASASSRWIIGANKADLITGLKAKIVDQNIDFEAIVAHSIDRTCQSYHNLYRQIKP